MATLLGRSARLAFALVAVTSLALRPVRAQQRTIVLVASDPLQAPLQELKPQMEREAGAPITLTFGTSPTLQRNILAGAPCDVAILPPASTTALRDAGAIETPVAIGRVGIGVGVRAGAQHPDLRSADAFKRALLDARSITYVREGASRMGIEQIFGKLGIVEQMKVKTNLKAGYEEMAASVSSGESALVLIPLSEILLMKGVESAGPLPPDIQSFVVFQAGAAARSANAAAAAAVLRALQSATARTIFRKDGLETP